MKETFWISIFHIEYVARKKNFTLCDVYKSFRAEKERTTSTQVSSYSMMHIQDFFSQKSIWSVYAYLQLLYHDKLYL